MASNEELRREATHLQTTSPHDLACGCSEKHEPRNGRLAHQKPPLVWKVDRIGEFGDGMQLGHSSRMIGRPLDEVVSEQWTCIRTLRADRGPRTHP